MFVEVDNAEMDGVKRKNDNCFLISPIRKRSCRAVGI